jgi:5-methylcytosine-specific restriction endonuclease McrA
MLLLKKKSTTKSKPKKKISLKKANIEQLEMTSKNLILLSQYHRCAMCTTDIRKLPEHYDYRIPLVMGGADKLENIQALCPNCYTLKTRRDRLSI